MIFAKMKKAIVNINLRIEKIATDRKCEKNEIQTKQKSWYDSYFQLWRST